MCVTVFVLVMPAHALTTSCDVETSRRGRADTKQAADSLLLVCVQFS